MWQLSSVNMPKQKFDIWFLLFPEWVCSNYQERKVFDSLELGQSDEAQQPPQAQTQWTYI